MKRIIGLLIVFVLTAPFVSRPANADATCVNLNTFCPGKGWVRSSCYETNPCGLSGGSASTSSGSSSAGALGAEVGKLIGNVIGEALRGNPEEDARRNAEQMAARRQAEEQELRRHEEMKNRLLGNMLETGNSTQLGLMGADSNSGLKLMTDDDLQVRKVPGAFGSTELRPTANVSAPAVSGLQLMLTDDEVRSSKQSAQGFDTGGKIMGAKLPPAPPAPRIKFSGDNSQMISSLRARLKENEAEKQALTDQLERLKQVPTPDTVAINQVQDKIKAKEELIGAQKRIYKDMTATDEPDVSGPDQPASNTNTVPAPTTAAETSR